MRSRLVVLWLHSLCRKVLGNLLIESRGYLFLRGVFYRELETSVRHVIIVDYSASKREFFVIIGLNSAVVAGNAPADEAGVYVSQYLGPGGLGDSPIPFRAFDQASATESLVRLEVALLKHGLPWLDSLEHLSDFAKALSEQFDGLKGELFLADGNRAEAAQWLRRYERRLLELPQDEDVIAALAETRQRIARCGEPDSR